MNLVGVTAEMVLLKIIGFGRHNTVYVVEVVAKGRKTVY